MKKSIRILLGGVFIAAIVSVFCVGAIDSKKTDLSNEGTVEPQLYQGYDIGKYGISSPEVFGWDADIIYSVARYKKTDDESAIHNAEDITSHNGGWISWHVYCVSDGEEATEYGYFINAARKDTIVPYYDTYGTKGYKNKLHIKGCMGSMSAGMSVGRAGWCPDKSAPVMNYVSSLS